jgi:hypothetical protein
LQTKRVSVVYHDVWTTVTSFGKTVAFGFGKGRIRTFIAPAPFLSALNVSAVVFEPYDK